MHENTILLKAYNVSGNWHINSNTWTIYTEILVHNSGNVLLCNKIMAHYISIMPHHWAK